MVAGAGGIKVRPEKMECEKLYHCIFRDKIMLVYKDNQDVLHCYEVEEKELVDQVRQCGEEGEIEEILVEFVARTNRSAAAFESSAGR